MATSPKNRVMVVTGASRGLGAAVAMLAGKRGYDVCVNYLSGEERAQQVVKAIRSVGRRAVAVRADVAREADVEAMFRTVDAELGRLTRTSEPTILRLACVAIPIRCF